MACGTYKRIKMKITSKLKFNTKLIAAHKSISKGGSAARLIGSALPNVLRIPAGATIELADKDWAQYEVASKIHVKNGDLVITEAVVLSAEDQVVADDALEAELRKQMAELKERRSVVADVEAE